jgi:DNA-binding LacI/PurR family transcriptional regulator
MVSDPFFLDIIGSVADELQRSGYDLLLSSSGTHPDQWYDDFIASSRADGLIVVGQAYHGDALLELAKSSAPVVVWGAPSDDLPYCTVGTDNYAGGLTAASHLLSHGRRRIAFLGDRALPEVTLRFAGYRAALEAAGVTVDDALLVTSSFTREGAQAAATALVNAGVAFDAIFAASDLIAMTAIRILQANGRDVPGDVAVVGFDDIRMAADYNPPLTTVSQDIAGGGKLLVSKLIRLMQGEDAESKALTPTLVVRGSTFGPSATQ